MASQPDSRTWDWSTPVGGSGWGAQAAALAAGTIFTAALFLGIARFERDTAERPPEVVEDLRMAPLAFEPPPPPVRPTESQPDASPLMGFELSPAESPVKIAVSPPELAVLLPEELSKAPPATAQLEPGLAAFKPRLTFEFDAQHIFQRNEVDQTPKVLDRPERPQVPRQVRNDAAVLRVTLLVVIDADGTASNIRLTKSSGTPAFDQIMVEYIKEWVFSPAMKNGKKVRCMIEQGITVQWQAGSRFQT